MKTNYEKLVGAKIERETEKAILINVQFGDEFAKSLWFPKSQVEIIGDAITASSWILDQKQREVNSQSNINTQSAPCALAISAPISKPFGS